MNALTVFIQTILNGLLMGGVYALIAVGLTIIFGVMKMINFAQGEFLMVGMYITWLLNLWLDINLYVLMIPVIIIMFLIASGVFKLTLKPILGRSSSSFIVITMGTAYVLQSIAQLIFGTNYKSINIPNTFKNSSIVINQYALSIPKVIAVGVGLVFIIIVYLFLKNTDFGRSMRATAESTNTSLILGINTERTFTIAYGIGITLAGIAGLLLTPMYYVYPTIGAPFKTITMAIVVMGGLGDTRGALISGFVAGIIEALTATYISFDFGPAGIYILLIIVLMVRPNGLFGKAARKA